MFASFATIAILGAAAAYVFLLVRSVEVGLFSLLAATWFDLTFGLSAGVIGRLHLNALDVIYLCLLVAGVVRFGRSLRFIHVSTAPAIGYLFVFAASLSRGISANGLFAAANEARGFVGPLLAVLYFSEAPVDERSLKRYCRWYLAFSVALCAVAAVAVAGFPLGVAAWTHASAAAMDRRYLPASAAAVIAMCAFLVPGSPGVRRPALGVQLLSALFLFVAICLRHRTVWGMMLAGIAVILFAESSLFRRILPHALVALIAVGALFLFEDARSNRIEDEFAASVSDTNTWGVARGWVAEPAL